MNPHPRYQMKKTVRRDRSRRGTTIAEIAPVIYFLFLVLVFPLLNLATIGLRYAFVVLAANEAALHASLSSTYSTDNGATDPSATKVASNVVTKIFNTFSGIHMTNLTTRIVVTNVTTKATTRQATKLAAPADTNANLYMIEPEIVAQVDPLVTMPKSIYDIPGVTRAFDVRISARKVAENPQGLNL